MLDLRQTLDIGDADPEYDEVEEGVEGGRYSSCANLLEDDDGDVGDDKYYRGGGLENILWPTDVPQHPRRALPSKCRRADQARHERLQGDDGDDEGFDGEGSNEGYVGLWEGGGFARGIWTGIGEGIGFQLEIDNSYDSETGLGEGSLGKDGQGGMPEGGHGNASGDQIQGPPSRGGGVGRPSGGTAGMENGAPRARRRQRVHVQRGTAELSENSNEEPLEYSSESDEDFIEVN